jgi:hypothetical protein
VPEERGLSEAVTAFVRGSISSVEQLAILLLLRANPFRSWSATEVSRELRGSEHSAGVRLSDLLESKLVEDRSTEGEARYIYAPASEKLRGTLDAVAEAYAERPHSVIALIYSDSGSH